jgi:hypothetical protein
MTIDEQDHKWAQGLKRTWIEPSFSPQELQQARNQIEKKLQPQKRPHIMLAAALACCLLLVSSFFLRSPPITTNNTSASWLVALQKAQLTWTNAELWDNTHHIENEALDADWLATLDSDYQALDHLLDTF